MAIRIGVPIDKHTAALVRKYAPATLRRIHRQMNMPDSTLDEYVLGEWWRQYPREARRFESIRHWANSLEEAARDRSYRAVFARHKAQVRPFMAEYGITRDEAVDRWWESPTCWPMTHGAFESPFTYGWAIVNGEA